MLEVLRGRGLKSVVLTGTYFEAGEGAGNEPQRTFSPYSLSKTLTFDAFPALCRDAGLPLGKFVIPNPFGPFEEPRFTAFLMNNWREGKPVEVKTPDYLRDNIHVDLLAAAYAKFVGASRGGERTAAENKSQRLRRNARRLCAARRARSDGAAPAGIAN